jgi:hypothetical protein
MVSVLVVMRMISRGSIPLGIGLMAVSPASGRESEVTAIMIPYAVPAPSVKPGTHCDETYCGFNALQDLWKQDALKRDPPTYLNADEVAVERAQFQAQVDRFGDPHAPAAPDLEIFGSGLCLNGYALNGHPGIHNCKSPE